jgi:hypothetical protein
VAPRRRTKYSQRPRSAAGKNFKSQTSPASCMCVAEIGEKIAVRRRCLPRRQEWEDREDAVPRKIEPDLFECRKTSPKEHIHRKSEGIHTRGEGSFSRYDATAMLTMRPCTGLPVDATSVVPLKKTDSTTRCWVCVSTVKCFSTKRFDSGSTIHHAQANLRRRVATKTCRLLGGSEDHEIPEVAMMFSSLTTIVRTQE